MNIITMTTTTLALLMYQGTGNEIRKIFYNVLHRYEEFSEHHVTEVTIRFIVLQFGCHENVFNKAWIFI